MQGALKPDQLFQGLLEDESISFNIRRSKVNFSRFPRRVAILPASKSGKMIIPGIEERREGQLVNELKNYQVWKDVKRYSFEVFPYLFSFLWRFKTDYFSFINEVKKVEPFTVGTVKRFKTAFKGYRASLRSNLSPGHIYLIPDADITFNRPGRFKQVYARRVLILEVRNGQIVMIPFSTRIERMNMRTDILFDPAYNGERLSSSSFPAVENFPYKIFSKKVVLCVYAAQPITEEVFLDSDLVSMGSVMRDLVVFAKDTMKNL